jgi:hypothetical protein
MTHIFMIEDRSRRPSRGDPRVSNAHPGSFCLLPPNRAEEGIPFSSRKIFYYRPLELLLRRNKEERQMLLKNRLQEFFQ